jgi:hypothetical protein
MKHTIHVHRRCWRTPRASFAALPRRMPDKLNYCHPLPDVAARQIDVHMRCIYIRISALHLLRIRVLISMILVGFFSTREVTCSRHSSGDSQFGENKFGHDKPRRDDHNDSQIIHFSFFLFFTKNEMQKQAKGFILIDAFRKEPIKSGGSI